MTSTLITADCMLFAEPSSVPAVSASAIAGTETQGIFVQWGRSEIMTGSGAFHRSAKPLAPWCFYANDFFLSQAQPWILPEQVRWSRKSTDVLPVAAPAWIPPSRLDFDNSFALLMERIRLGEIRKAVPAVAEEADWPVEDWLKFAYQFRCHADDQGHTYSYQDGNTGFAGITPEILIHVKGRTLRTMALAGTARSEAAADLLRSPKMELEHRIVVDELRQRLSVLGEVIVEPRKLTALGAMTHLCTPLSVELEDTNWMERPDDLIRLLHPTPALGIAPRTTQNLELLGNCRRKSHVPDWFGGLIGARGPDELLLLVAIRGAFWKDGRAYLPAGCGLVDGSEVESEWQELELKRHWVKHALGLA